MIFGSQSSGASNDFQQSTQIARAMITQYGMSDKLGPIQYEGDSQVFMGRDLGQNPSYSQQVAYQIDQEVMRIVGEAHDEARRILEENSEAHKLIAEKLLEVETLDANEIKSLYEDGVMPTKRDVTDEKYPRESEEESENVGASFDEIKEAKEEAEESREDRLDDEKRDDTSSQSEDEDQSDKNLDDTNKKQ